jgi:Fe-S cluster assembly ATP-binding protein
MLKSRKDKRSINEVERDYKNLVKELGRSSNHGHKFMNNETMTATECKKNELLHIMMTDPKLIILDEIDKDIEEDELESFAIHIKNFLKNNKKAAIIATPNKKFLDILEPTHVNIMVQGAIRRKGSQELYKRIIEDDYTQLS